MSFMDPNRNGCNYCPYFTLMMLVMIIAMMVMVILSNDGDEDTVPPKVFRVIMLILKSLILTFGHLLQHNKVVKPV